MTSIRGLKIPELVQVQGLRVGIVKSLWNEKVVSALLDGAVNTLQELSVAEITVETVGGAFELPSAAAVMAKSGQFDAIIAIGCLIKGESMHFEYISGAAVDGLMRVGLDRGIPVINGVLNVLSEAQALARSGLEGTHGNEAVGWAKTAVMQASLFRKYTK